MIYVENININSCQKGTTASEDISVQNTAEPGNILPHFSDEAAFNRNQRSAYIPNSPPAIMPPTTNTSHEPGVRNNSISSISAESANETDLSCTPSPSSATIPASKTVSTFNNNLSQVSHATTAATNSSSMVVQNSPSTAVSPSTNSPSMMAAATASSQHSFTLTPLSHIPSGYSGMCAPGVGSSYFPSGCSGSSVRFGNANQQHHNFDGSFPSTWTPFGGAGMVRPNYNGIQGFMSGQNQVFPGSTFQGGSVSNTEGSSSFFTHGGGNLTVQSPAANHNVDRGSRGGDSNGSSPQSVGGGTNSPHLSHGIFGQNLEEGHGGAGGGNNTVGIIGGGGTRKREIRLIKNREAARECRRKKKEYIKCLENRVAVLENQNKALIEELKSLKALYSSASSTKVPPNDGSKNNQMDTR